MVPDSILFYNEQCLLEIIVSKDFEPDNKPIHFISSGVYFLTLRFKI